MAVRSAGAQILSGVVSLGIQVGGTMMLGRLLTPRDFGLVTMVTTFSFLFMNAAANGFADSILQVKDITHRLASTLFWINIALAVLLTIAFAAIGPLLARFFGEIPVAGITAGMAATVLLTALWVVHTALLRKAMRFSALAKNDIIARASGVAVSVAFALVGWGYWALVMGACALSLSTAIGVWILCPWMPGIPRRGTGTRSPLVFAGHITARYTLNYVARNTDNLLVGWRFGANALGFYKKAYDLFTLSLYQLISNNANVAVSALSRVRDDRPQYLRYVLGAIGITAFIGMGLAADFTIIGRDLIRVLLGPGWETAGLIFTFFAPSIGIMLVNGIHGWLHVSLGRADRYLTWGVLEWFATVALFLTGLPWGPQGVAVAWGVSYWALTLSALAFAGKPVGLTTAQVLSATWRYVMAGLAAGAIAAIGLARLAPLAGATGISGALSRILAGTALFAALYLGAVVLLHGGLAPLQKIVELMRDLRRAKAPSQAVPA